ncbi:MAG: SDR family NAD(P)-dependent oxidoreductase [Trueperaceae bacterium]|nr:SDR family NAD(P)-dependent oxidoreductase [Trueperaceae bacterium]
MERAKVVLVTHVGEGFGRAVALGYGQAGYDVVCADRDVDLAARTAAEVEELGGQAIPLQTDPTSALDLTAAFGKVLEIFGSLSGVVHVVARDSVTPFERLAESELAELLDEAVKSSVLVLRSMQRTAPDGWVVLVAPPPRPGRPHLAAVGGALARLAAAFPPPSLTDPDDDEDAPADAVPSRGLRVNVVVPSRPAADPRHDLALVHAVRLLGGQAGVGVHGTEIAVRLPPPPTVVEALLPEVRAALDDRVRQRDDEDEDDDVPEDVEPTVDADALDDEQLDDGSVVAARGALHRWMRAAQEERAAAEERVLREGRAAHERRSGPADPDGADR